jgi:hypothetical protein
MWKASGDGELDERRAKSVSPCGSVHKQRMCSGGTTQAPIWNHLCISNERIDGAVHVTTKVRYMTAAIELNLVYA